MNRVCAYCGGKKVDGNCPTCPDCPGIPLQDPMAQQVLQQISKGCSQRLQGVLRQSLMPKEKMFEFLSQGNNKLVVVTNVDPDELLKNMSVDPKTVKAIMFSAAIIDGHKKYMLMSVSNGKLTPLGAPTIDFNKAFGYLTKGSKIVGSENIAILIDEDIPCSAAGGVAMTPISEIN